MFKENKIIWWVMPDDLRDYHESQEKEKSEKEKADEAKEEALKKEAEGLNETDIQENLEDTEEKLQKATEQLKDLEK